MGVRACLAVITGSGAVSIAKEAGKSVLQYYGRKWIGTAFIIGGGFLRFGGIPLITNASKIVKYAKACHNCCATIIDTTEITAGLLLIALEFVIFGRPVPKKTNSTFSLYPESSDFLKDVPFVD